MNYSPRNQVLVGNSKLHGAFVPGLLTGLLVGGDGSGLGTGDGRGLGDGDISGLGVKPGVEGVSACFRRIGGGYVVDTVGIRDGVSSTFPHPRVACPTKHVNIIQL
jgi:hypothetical protein